MDKTYSTTEVSIRTGLSYRQLDYWARTGGFRPAVDARGSGTQRRYTGDQVRALHLMHMLRNLGMGVTMARQVATSIRDDMWDSRVFISETGRVYLPPRLPRGANGWLIDLRTCSEDVDQPVPALAG